MIDFAESLKEKRRLDLTPMIDVIFLLLIFFMLTSIYSKPVIPLNLPEGASAEKEERESLEIAIDRDGVITVDGSQVELASLEDRFSHVLVGDPSRNKHFDCYQW